MSEEHKVVEIDSVKQHPLNPRVGVVPAIKDAISRNGWHGTLVVQKSTGFILAGNHRWLAAKELGLRNVPVHLVDVDDDTAKRILLADNRTADLASYDDPKLQTVLNMIIEQEPEPEKALAGTGYTPEDANQLALALGGGEAQDWGSRGTTEGARERYENTTIRQIVWVMNEDVYERVVPLLKGILESQGLETFSEVMLWLVDRYAAGLKQEVTA